jgi:hypothetical protein
VAAIRTKKNVFNTISIYEELEVHMVGIVILQDEL